MMHLIFQQRRAVCIAAAALFAVTTSYAQPAQMAMPMKPAASADALKSMTGSEGMKMSMMAGMESMHKMPMSGDNDKDFAMMMKLHHQQGVEMAQMQIAHGKSAAMKKMAKRIVAAQNKEIQQFDRWLATQK